MTRVTTKAESSHLQSDTAVHLFDNWIDPIETEIRGRIRGFIEELIRSELETALARPRYGRRTKSNDDADGAAGAAGHRHGNRTGWTRRLRPCGTAFRCSDARFTSTGTCSRMRPSACTRRSPPITTT